MQTCITLNCPFISCCTEYNFLVDRGGKCRVQEEILSRAKVYEGRKGKQEIGNNKVEDPEGVRCNRLCDCEEQCSLEGKNSYRESYYNQVRREMESVGIVERDIVAAISIMKKLRNED